MILIFKEKPDSAPYFQCFFSDYYSDFRLVVDEIIEKLDRVITLIKTQRGVSEDGDLQ